MENSNTSSNTSSTENTTRMQMTARDVMGARYLTQTNQSRVSAFRNAARAYYVNADGSVSTRREMDYFK
jgi:hypothetical protein